MTGKSLDKRIENIERKKNRSDIVYELYEKDKLLRKKDINNVIKVIDNIQFPQDTFNISQIKFILMFKSSSQEYIFIYSLGSEFYKLVIKSNISNMTNIILNKLNKKINKNHNAEFVDKTISFEKTDLPNVFQIISNEKLVNKDPYFKASVKPIILKQFYKPEIIKEQYIDTFYYYSTDLLDIINHKPIGYIDNFMPNLYDSKIHIPILIKNFYNSNKNLNPNKLIYEDNKDIFNDCVKILCNSPINYIWKNYKNCGYDFIENIDNEQQKLTVYVCPSYLFDKSVEKNVKYLNNFIDLEDSHIEMLKAFQNLYYNDNYNCFIHQTLGPYFSCLHFHVIKKELKKEELYKRNYSNMELGSFLIQDIYISELINNITINSKYYINYNYSLIKDY
jgi:hypothetical protein